MLAVIERIRAAIRKVNSVVMPKDGRSHQLNGILQEIIMWKVSKEGWLKTNCDRGFIKDERTSRIGVVVRNANGRLIDGICVAIKADCALLAEALAVREGIKLVVAKGYKKKLRLK